MRRAADKDGAFQADEFRGGHFKADGEEEKDHADFRKQFHGMGIVHKAEGRGAAQDARQEKAHDGRNLDLVADEEHGDGKAKKRYDVRKKGYIHR